MTTDVSVQSKPSFGVTFEKTISDGNYGGEKISAWVSADVALDATTQDKEKALNDAAFLAKAIVFAQHGVPFKADDDGVLRAEAAVKRAFPGTVTEAPSPNVANTQPAATSGGVRIKGRQHGDIPEWLITDAAKFNVTEVWDNRDRVATSPKSPWFKPVNTVINPATGKEVAFWPPKAGGR